MHRFSSFKVKLVVYFVALTLLPLTAAFYGFSSVTRRSEERRVDARVQAGLRAALTAYGDVLNAAQRQATQLARNPQVQRALRDGDLAALERIASSAPGDVRLERSTRPITHPLAASRSVLVYSGGRALGQVTVLVHLDNSLLGHLRRRTGLDRVDRLVAVRDGRVLLGPGELQGASLSAPAEGTEVVTVRGTEFRSLSAQSLSEPKGMALVVLSPQSLAESAAAGTERRLMTALLTALLLIAIVAYLLSRSVVGRLRHLANAATAIAGGHLSQRVRVQGRDEFAVLGRSFNAMAAELEARVDELEMARQRLRGAIMRFGEALEATHDPDHLREVIVESAVEATGAAGGELEGEGKYVTAGDPEAQGERLELPLTAGANTFGRLTLNGPDFGSEERELAESLARQAVVALENARLHAIVERQALVDGLTGLANRRRSDEMLHLELTRAARLGAPIAFVLLDVDRFKSINDRFGHPAGDAVLREVATLLAETVREIDLAGRWGGEEFALILPGTDLDGGVQLAERLRAALEERPIKAAPKTELFVTASFGVAAFPGNGTEDELVAAADAALYEAKGSGRNRVVSEAALRPATAPESGRSS
jgi:diguanylate cyclase (GGDEF)-like protein